MEWIDALGLAKKLSKVGSPKDAQSKINKKQGPKDIVRIDSPEQSVPGSQWHAHCKCGSGYHLDGSIHDTSRGRISFSKKTIEWLNTHDWSIYKK